MTQPQTQTQLPRALRARGESLSQAAAQQGAPVTAPPAPQYGVAPQPSNVHVLPGVQQDSPAEVPRDADDLDLSAFAVEASDASPHGSPVPHAPYSVPASTPAAAPAQAVGSESDISRLERRIEDLQRAMAPSAAPQEVPTAAQQAARALLEIQVEDLTPTERETYSAAIPVVQKLLNIALAEQVAPKINAFHQEVAARDQRIEQLQAQIEQTRSSTFQDRVRTVVPDIDALTKDPGFAAYMDTAVPIMGAGATVRTALANAVRAQDVQAVQAIVQGFRGASPAQPTRAPQAAFVAPGVSPSPVASPATQTAKPMLKLSARLQAGRDFTAGRITKAQLDRIDAAYDVALREGRVAMDK